MKISILIPSLVSRLVALGDTLEALGNHEGVEILVHLDNKTRSLGDKRNELLALAHGEFVVFVNDDDPVVDDFVPKLLRCVEEHPEADVFSFHGQCMKRSAPNASWEHSHFMQTSVKHPEPPEMRVTPLGVAVLAHKPWFWCLWRAEVARKGKFSDCNYGEDRPWVVECSSWVDKEIIVPEIMFVYHWDDSTSEAACPA